MPPAFDAKVRPIGDSFGVIIPKRVLEGLGASSGDTVRVSLLPDRKKALEELRKLRGSLKTLPPFERDHDDRIERYEAWSRERQRGNANAP